MPNTELIEDVAAELNKANLSISLLVQFIEQIEAITIDKHTQARIQAFMRENGYWPKN